MTEKLLPCPFCGGDTHIERVGTPRQSCIVACGECGWRLEAREETSECGGAWNRRDALQSQDREDALIEVMLEACDEWSQYVEVDTAPRTLREHIQLAIDHARRVEGDSNG